MKVVIGILVVAAILPILWSRNRSMRQQVIRNYQECVDEKQNLDNQNRKDAEYYCSLPSTIENMYNP